MTRLSFTLAGAALVAGALGAGAQSRNDDGIPNGHRPPPGMCRVWVDGVPPGRQAPATDCATARRRASGMRNARVIHGESYGNDGGRYDPPNNRRGDRRWDDRRGRRDDDRWERDRDHDRDRDRRDRDDRGRWDRDRFPSRLPEMQDAARFRATGRLTGDADRWLRGNVERVTFRNRDRDQRPEVATWYDRAGRVVQVWHDTHGDSTIDRIDLYENGRVVKVIR